jgi:hypothetical protein
VVSDISFNMLTGAGEPDHCWKQDASVDRPAAFFIFIGFIAG